MIPLRSATPLQRFPWGTYTLISINVAVFAHEIMLGERLQPFLLLYGWVPASFFHALAESQMPVFTPLLTSMFLHGGWLHLLGNLLYLHIFGGNVEDRLGHLRYLSLYFLGGVIAALVQTYATPFSQTPMIGASGAIATVTGAYCMFYPTARVSALVPLVFSFRVVQVRAVWYVLLWLVLQFFSGLGIFSANDSNSVGVAWWAHVGGFVAGLILGPLFLLKKKRRFRHPALPLPPLWHSPKSALR